MRQSSQLVRAFGVATLALSSTVASCGSNSNPGASQGPATDQSGARSSGGRPARQQSDSPLLSVDEYLALDFVNPTGVEPTPAQRQAIKDFLSARGMEVRDLERAMRDEQRPVVDRKIANGEFLGAEALEGRTPRGIVATHTIRDGDKTMVVRLSRDEIPNYDIYLEAIVQVHEDSKKWIRELLLRSGGQPSSLK